MSATTVLPSSPAFTMPNHDFLDQLIAAARLAPSGDNLQPCRFVVDRDDCSITIVIDPQRDASPMNAGQRMARFAAGAALENVVQTADRNGLKYSVSYGSDNDIRIDFEPDEQAPRLELEDCIGDRVSNRKRYRGTAISSDQLQRLKSGTPALDGISANWVVDPEILKTLCQLIGRADSLLLSAKPARDAFLETVRFDAAVNAEVEEGLSLGSLELPFPQRQALRLMPIVPDRVLRLFGGPRLFRSAALRLATSASGFCVVTCPDSGDKADFQIGQVFQRAWLTVTRERFAAQPMMSLVVLRNMLASAPDDAKRTIQPGHASELLSEFDEFASTFSSGVPWAILRFGVADAPSGRTGRLPVERLVSTS